MDPTHRYITSDTLFMCFPSLIVTADMKWLHMVQEAVLVTSADIDGSFAQNYWRIHS